MTAYEIECLDGLYTCKGRDLAAAMNNHHWPLHMAGKEWVDIDEFTTAWMVALILHGKGGSLSPAVLRIP